MTFDRYHLTAKLREVIDAVRRQEVATRPELTHTRWLWLKHHANLLAMQQRGDRRPGQHLQEVARPAQRCGRRWANAPSRQTSSVRDRKNSSRRI
jgi:hypothetical protein